MFACPLYRFVRVPKCWIKTETPRLICAAKCIRIQFFGTKTVKWFICHLFMVSMKKPSHNIVSLHNVYLGFFFQTLITDVKCYLLFKCYGIHETSTTRWYVLDFQFIDFTTSNNCLPSKCNWSIADFDYLSSSSNSFISFSSEFQISISLIIVKHLNGISKSYFFLNIFWEIEKSINRDWIFFSAATTHLWL